MPDKAKKEYVRSRGQKTQGLKAGQKPETRAGQKPETRKTFVGKTLTIA